jgi:hypothetical protein
VATDVATRLAAISLVFLARWMAPALLHEPAMTISSHLLGLGLVLVAACGGDDGTSVDAGGGGGNVTCEVTATITAMMSARTVTGVGKADCTGAASLEVETCVQWNPSGTFVDIQCMSSTKSATTNQVDNLASCGITSGRQFRARVNATVNGVAKPEVLSTEIACF